MNVDRNMSNNITNLIHKGDLSNKPGWVRISLHPIMTIEEIDYIADSVILVINNYEDWEKDYEFSAETGEFYYKNNSNNNFDLRTEYKKCSKILP